jgi:hypothetical protein
MKNDCMPTFSRMERPASIESIHAMPKSNSRMTASRQVFLLAIWALLCHAVLAQTNADAAETKVDVIEALVRSDSLDVSSLFSRFARTNETASERVLRRTADCARLARRCYEHNNYVKATGCADLFFSELREAQNDAVMFTRAEQLQIAVLRFYVYERVLDDHASAAVAAQECADLSGAEASKWVTIIERLKRQSSQERIYSLSTASLNQAYEIEPGSARLELKLLYGGGCQVICLNTGGGQYRIEKSFNLIDWISVSTISGNQQPLTVDDPASDTARAFYRVVRTSPSGSN